jgi:hypothetical protein
MAGRAPPSRWVSPRLGRKYQPARRARTMGRTPHTLCETANAGELHQAALHRASVTGDGSAAHCPRGNADRSHLELAIALWYASRPRMWARVSVQFRSGECVDIRRVLFPAPFPGCRVSRPVARRPPPGASGGEFHGMTFKLDPGRFTSPTGAMPSARKIRNSQWARTRNTFQRRFRRTLSR